MKRTPTIALLTVTFIVVACTGCGTIRTSPNTQVGGAGLQPLKDTHYAKVVAQPGFTVTPVDVAVVRAPSVQGVLPQKDIVPEQMAILYRNELVDALNKSKAFTAVLKDDNAADKQPMTGGKQHLYFDTSFAELDPGNRALRYMVGYGAGRTKVEVITKVSDSQGNLLLHAADRFVAAYGIFGGSSKSFVVSALTKTAQDQGKTFERLAKKKKKAISNAGIR